MVDSQYGGYMKAKKPDEFVPDDTEEITVQTVAGHFNGRLTLHVPQIKALSGPIHQINGKFQRWVRVQPNQKNCENFEKWLLAFWSSEYQTWTVDYHQDC